MITRYWKSVLSAFVLLPTLVISPSAFTPAASSAARASMMVKSAEPQAMPVASHSGQIDNGMFEPGIILVKLEPEIAFGQQPSKAPTSTVDALNVVLEEWGVSAAEPVFPPSEDDDHYPDQSIDELDQAGSGRRGIWYRLTFPVDIDVADAVAALKTASGVIWAEPNFLYFPTSTSHVPDYPNDPYYFEQWALPHIGADRAWNNTTGSPSVIIAVIDTGVRLGHPDLMSKLWMNDAEFQGSSGVDDDNNGYVDDLRGWDWADNDNVPADINVVWRFTGHGTHVAGIAAAATNNGLGVAGVCPGCLIMPLKVCSTNGCPTDNIVRAIRYARSEGARVLNISLGGYEYSVAYREEIDEAWSAGVTVVAGAGNDTTSALSFPAAYNHVIGVSATKDSSDSLSQTSNYGFYIDLAAPGVRIYSTTAVESDYAYKDGTSMAAPFVSGTAALVYSVLPTDLWSADRVANMLQATATDLYPSGWDNQYGWGRLNTYQAVWQAMNPPKIDLRVRLYHASRTNHSASVVVTVRHRSSGKVAYETVATTNSEGRVLGLPIRGLPTGNYDISVKTDRSVSTRIANVRLTAGTTSSVDFSNGWASFLKAGDFNQDDKVNMFDLVRVLKAFQNQDLSFDFDGSGRVTILEVNMVLTGLRNGLVGDDFPYQHEPSHHYARAVLPTGTGRIELVPLPYTPEYQVGDQFDVYAFVVTPSQAMAGADLIVKYDPCALRVLGITNGNVFDSLQQQSDHPDLGEIRLSGEGEYVGVGTLVILRFEVMAGSTQTSLSALFRPNQTTESNMVEPDTEMQVLGDTYGVSLDLIGNPARPPITIDVDPPHGSYLNRMDSSIAVTVHDVCGGVIVESVEFEVQHDGVWETMSVDQNKYNGWSALLQTAAIQDQPIQLRTIVKDDEGYSKASHTVSYILDRVAPTPAMTLPAAVPGNRQIPVAWSATDNQSGVRSYDVEFRQGTAGNWTPWFTQTNSTSATYYALPGQDYYFRVRARDFAGNESRFSDEYASRSVSPRVFLPYVRVQ